RDQWAGRIEHRQTASRCFLLHAPRHAMGAENGDGTRRHLGEILDEDCAFVLQAFDHVFVVNDLVPHIDRRAIFFERTLDNLDRANDTRAKAAGLRKIHFHGTPVTKFAPLSCRSPSRRLAWTFAISAPGSAPWRRRALCPK